MGEEEREMDRERDREREMERGKGQGEEREGGREGMEIEGVGRSYLRPGLGSGREGVMAVSGHPRGGGSGSSFWDPRFPRIT